MKVQSQFIEMFGAPDFMKRLGDYVSVRTGKLDANASVEDGQYPFFTCAEKTLSIDTYAFDCIAVLLAGNGEFCVKHYNGKFNAYQRTYVIESKDESVLSTKYLYAWLKDYANILKANAIGGVIKYIKLGDITNAQINLPVLERQLGYVRIYEQAYKSKFVGFKSQFIEMFGNPVTNPKGWKTSKIKDVAPESPSKESVDGRVWLLNLDMIESNTGKVIEKVYEDSENALSVQPFDEGNVLFSKLRPYLNKVVIPDEPGLATTELSLATYYVVTNSSTLQMTLLVELRCHACL